MIANYIVKPQAWWDNMLKEAGTEGAALINQKWEICNNWLAEKWEFSLDDLRAEVQKRQANLDWDMIMSFDEMLKEKRENAKE